MSTLEDKFDNIVSSDTYSKSTRESRRELEDSLTPIQQKFAMKIVETQNDISITATDCYLMVSPKATKKSATSKASKFLADENVKKYIEILSKEMLMSTSISFNEVLENAREVLRMAAKGNNGRLYLEVNKHLTDLLKIKLDAEKTTQQYKNVNGDNGDGVVNSLERDEGIQTLTTVLQGLSKK